MAKKELRVGFSGWTYEPWRDHFYPKKHPQKKELEYASRQVNSIEINGTFYSLQRPSVFQNWLSQVPEDFMFAVKAPQFITHIRRLKDVEEPLANFMASGLLALGAQLGPILWQFPPSVTLKDKRFDEFAKRLPHTAQAAAKLAAQHGPKMKGRALIKAQGRFPVRHAFELRHPSFANKNFLDMLRAHNIAAVISHAGAHSVEVTEPTADFVYLRFLGDAPKFKRGYPQSEIDPWAKQIKKWNKTKDVFAYFGTEAKEWSPFDALKLSKALGLKSSDKA